VGGAVGLLAGLGTLVIPGLGPFIAAGPIMATISGAAVGATIGGIAGGLIGLGIPEVKAKHYENRLKEGFILVSVHTDDAERLHRARLVFEAADACDIANSEEIEAAEKGKPKESRVEGRSYVGRDW
jgi:outer membrane lipoprotein SlyB